MRSCANAILRLSSSQRNLPLALPCGVFLLEGLERKSAAVSPALKSDNAVNIDIAPALLQLCDRRRFRRRPLIALTRLKLMARSPVPPHAGAAELRVAHSLGKNP